MCIGNIRVCGGPGQLAVDVLAGGVVVQAGEGQRRRQSVFITELCWCHPVELLGFRKVHLGSNQDTWDVALHVVLLHKRSEND